MAKTETMVRNVDWNVQDIGYVLQEIWANAHETRESL